MLEAPRHRDDQGHMDRPEELKQLFLPTRNDAVAAVYPSPDHSQSVEVRYQMTSAHGVRQLAALSSPKIRDRRPGSPVEQDNETIMTPPAPQKRHDLPILDNQHEVGSRRAGSFDDGHRGGGPRGTPDGGGPPGRKDDDARLSQGPSKPPVPEVVLIPPTRPPSPIHKPRGPVPPEHTHIAHAHPEPSRRAPTPPEPVRPPRTQPSGPPQSGSRAETGSVRKKKGILSFICPCLG